jgi:hypothetical protein
LQRFVAIGRIEMPANRHISTIAAKTLAARECVRSTFLSELALFSPLKERQLDRVDADRDETGRAQHATPRPRPDGLADADTSIARLRSSDCDYVAREAPVGMLG